MKKQKKQQPGRYVTAFIPAEVYEPIAAMAERERRGVGPQIIIMLERLIERERRRSDSGVPQGDNAR
jgi:hypothetical protein